MELLTKAQRARLLANGNNGDGDTLFGLADLGFGSPELGCCSLAEIAAVRLPFGLAIERDLHFRAAHPLSVYAEAASAAGRIVETGPELDAAASNRKAAAPTADGGTRTDHRRPGRRPVQPHPGRQAPDTEIEDDSQTRQPDCTGIEANS